MWSTLHCVAGLGATLICVFARQTPGWQEAGQEMTRPRLNGRQEMDNAPLASQLSAVEYTSEMEAVQGQRTALLSE